MTLEKIYTITCHSSINNGKMQNFAVDSSFLDFHNATERLNELKIESIKNFKEIYGDHQYTVIQDNKDDKCIVRTLNDDDILTIKIEITFLYK